MKESDIWFAKNITPSHRFVIALRLTLKTTMHKNFLFGNECIIMMLLGNYDRRLFVRAFSDEKISEVRKRFVQVYNDTDFIVNYLNKIVTEKSLRRIEMDKDIVDATLDNIFNENFSKLGIDLF